MYQFAVEFPAREVSCSGTDVAGYDCTVSAVPRTATISTVTSKIALSSLITALPKSSFQMRVASGKKGEADAGDPCRGVILTCQRSGRPR